MTTSAPPPAAGIDFDPASLRAYLRGALAHLHGEMSVERIGGGQSNPTYFLTFDGAAAPGAGPGGAVELVLRKRPPGDLPRSAHDVGREFRILSALQDTAVPVPRAVLYSDDVSVVGTPFYLMQRLHGRIFHQSALAEVPREQRRDIYLNHARGLATLHGVDFMAVGLGDLARPGSFLARQVDRWTRAWGDERAAEVGKLSAWLKANPPAGERVALTHGDFKLTNVVFDPHDATLIGVLDWELAAIGDPLLDLAHNWSAMWATSPEEYGGILGVDLGAAGLPTAEEYIAAYFETAGAAAVSATAGGAAELPAFHRALALFRNAGIFRGIGERAAAGIATSANAASQGRMAHVYLDRALAVAESAG